MVCPKVARLTIFHQLILLFRADPYGERRGGGGAAGQRISGRLKRSCIRNAVELAELAQNERRRLKRAKELPGPANGSNRFETCAL